MSRTTLCILTAAALAAVSLGTMLARRHVLGDEVRLPAGPGTWKVILRVEGHAQGNSRLITLAPLALGRQHILRESCRSDELLDRPAESRSPERRQVLWSRRAGTPDGPFRAHYEFHCAIDRRAADRPEGEAYAPPRPGDHLHAEPAGTDAEAVGDVARDGTAGLHHPLEQAEALFRFVDHEIANEPALGGRPARPAECLRAGSGDSGGKARLLAALLRSRGVPARLVTGLILDDGPEQSAHAWVEAWIDGRWVPMCPFHHHFGKVPPTYLVLALGDAAVARGHPVRDLRHAFLVERVGPEEAGAADVSPLRRAFRSLSLYMLPPAEQRLVEFLLLLPVAALIVCVFRNVVGLSSFGTFAPALIGLAFRDLRSAPGVLVFVGVVLAGWGMRRLLGRYHLLQVPRTAFLLSLVVVLLVGCVVGASTLGLAATDYLSLFPLVILVGMIERFWTLETEDGTAASFRTLLTTLLMAGAVALVLSLRVVADQVFCYPETVGLVMAAQLLLGRYTGYRLSELFRFRDMLAPAEGV
jgi:hypothetical protein